MIHDESTKKAMNAVEYAEAVQAEKKRLSIKSNRKLAKLMGIDPSTISKGITGDMPIGPSHHDGLRRIREISEDEAAEQSEDNGAWIQFSSEMLTSLKINAHERGLALEDVVKLACAEMLERFSRRRSFTLNHEQPGSIAQLNERLHEQQPEPDPSPGQQSADDVTKLTRGASRRAT